MSAEADTKRDRRRVFAAPGGSLDRVVRILAVALPALVGAILATMLIAPLSPRGEVSFMLDRNKADVAEDRLRVDEAMYRGEDARGRPFSLSAGGAVQTSAAVPVVRLRDLTGRLLLDDGPAVLQARGGQYNITDQLLAIDGEVRFAAADGYRMTARNVSVDLRQRTLFGEGRVDGEIPAGTFEADRLRADLAAHTVTLDGNARLRMVPGRMQMP